MKKVSTFLLLAGSLMIISSACKKDYKCECQSRTYSGKILVDSATRVESFQANSRDAHNRCFNAEEVHVVPGFGSVRTVDSCSLK